MWPERGEAVDHTIHAEAAVAELWGEALRRWVPSARAAALPSLTASGELPPDPAAVEQTSANWVAAAAVITGGLFALWVATYAAARRGLGLPALDVAETVETGIDPAALRIVARNTGLSVRDLAVDVAEVRAAPALAETATGFVALADQTVAETPSRVAFKLSATLTDFAADGTEAMRSATEDALDPDGPLLRDFALAQSRNAAGLQNHAVLQAAKGSEEPLEKTWIATLDAKTRRTHWAADGQRVALDGTFTVGHAHLDVPGDPSGPPEEVANCRCRVGVLAPGEKIPDEVDRHTERLDGRDSVVINRGGRSQAEEIRRRADEGNVRARDSKDGVGRVASGPPTIGVGMEMFRTFTDQPIAFLGVPTSDGRLLANDIALSFRSFPLPLMWSRQNTGHDESFAVAVIESAHVKGGEVLASGYLLNTPEADEAAAQLAHGVTRPSIDMAQAEWTYTDENENPLDDAALWDRQDAGLPVLMTFTAGEIMGATLVAFAAFGDTRVALNAQRESRDVALVASAVAEFKPRTYPAEYFAEPKVRGWVDPTYENGRLFGYVAAFGECHRSIQTECVLAPRSPSGYENFHTSAPVLLDNGDRIPVGRLTVNTGHAGQGLAGRAAAAHYDNTGTCWALVRVGENETGIWFSGVPAPWATPEQIEMGLSAPLSGDWRDFGQGLDLVAALSVNTPGFAARGRTDAQGRPVALVASLHPPQPGQLSRDDVKAAVREALAEHSAFAAGGVDAHVERRPEYIIPAELGERRLAEIMASARAALGQP